MTVYEIYESARFHGWTGFKDWFCSRVMGSGVKHCKDNFEVMVWVKLRTYNKPMNDEVYLVKTKHGVALQRVSEWKGVTHYCEIVPTDYQT